MSEDDLAVHFEELFSQVADTHRAVFNTHVRRLTPGWMRHRCSMLS